MRWLLVVMWSLGSLLVAQPTRAQQVQTDVSAREVAVGETFQVELSAEIEADSQARAPQLKVQGPAEVFGPSLRTSYQVRMQNFDVQRSRKIVATWTLTPQAEGRLVIGPPSMELGGKRISGEQVVVQVVSGPARQARPARPDPFARDPFGSDPFDFDPFDIWNRSRRHSSLGLRQAPEKLQLDRAPDSTAFLYAFVDAERVVVGEPITLEIYAYGSRGPFREVSPTEPSLPKFLSFPVVESSHEQPAYQVDIEGQEFTVLKLRELILVPLESGTLEVGAMSAVLRGVSRGYPSRGSQFGTTASSQPRRITVVEPPEKGRPDDYVIGDVGSFELDSRVEPRQLHQGDYAAVSVQIRGRGHLPSSIQLPETEGIVWGEPVVRGDSEVDSGALGGSRTLKYTAQINRAGQIDLGQVRLPYYDPDKQRYIVARADLGTISAEPRDSIAAGDAANESDTEIPLTPRRELGSAGPTRHEPSMTLWGLVLGSPLLVLLLMAGRWGVVWASPRLRKWRATGGTNHFEEAAGALRESDLSRAVGLIERGMYENIERTHGIRARGLLRSELAAALERAGVSEETASSLQDLLQRCETTRYGGGNSDANALLEEARRLSKSLRAGAKG